jgi:protein CpxP
MMKTSENNAKDRWQSMKLMAAAMSLALIVLCGPAVLAQRPGGRGGTGGPGGIGGPGFLDHRLARILDLTDAQKEQIATLREQARAASETYRDQLPALHEQQRALTEAATFNEASFRALAGQIAPIHLEILVINTRTESATYNLLTADQKARLAEVRKAIEERIGNGPPAGHPIEERIGNGPPAGHHGRGFIGGRFADLLGLTTAQKEQIAALRDQAERASETYVTQLAALHEQLRALIEAAAFNESAVRALAAQMSTVQTELSVIQARTESAIYNLLTAEQKAKLAELHKKAPGQQREEALREESVPAGRRSSSRTSSRQ